MDEALDSEVAGPHPQVAVEHRAGLVRVDPARSDGPVDIGRTAEESEQDIGVDRQDAECPDDRPLAEQKSSGGSELIVGDVVEGVDWLGQGLCHG